MKGTTGTNTESDIPSSEAERGKHNEVLHDMINELLDREERDLRHLSAQEKYEIIADKIGTHPDSIIPVPSEDHNELLKRFIEAEETGKPLKVKVGVDPTGPNIHAGHGITLRMMRRFQQMGAVIQFVVGDMTAMIGDPSDRDDARVPLTPEQVRKNMQTYIEQASRIIDLSENNPNVEIHYNSEWLNKDMLQWLPKLQHMSASNLFQRADFKERLANGGTVSIAELLYALFMAEDSVQLNPDIEIGGLDQLKNLLTCRESMSKAGLRPEVIVTVDLLPGTTGQLDDKGRYVKMSKSVGNFISLTEEPSELYGKIMSIPDEVMWIWYRELTEITSEQLDQLKRAVIQGYLHPKDVKQALAFIVTASLNDLEKAENAKTLFDSKYGKARVLVPEDAVEVRVELPKPTIIAILRGVTGNSGSDLRRTANQGGISILRSGANQFVPISVDDLFNALVESGDVVKIGKRGYYRII